MGGGVVGWNGLRGIIWLIFLAFAFVAMFTGGYAQTVLTICASLILLGHGLKFRWWQEQPGDSRSAKLPDVVDISGRNSSTGKSAPCEKTPLKSKTVWVRRRVMQRLCRLTGSDCPTSTTGINSYRYIVQCFVCGAPHYRIFY